MLLYDWLMCCPTEPFSLLPQYRFVASLLQLLVETDTERPSCFQCWIHIFNTLMFVSVSWNAEDRFCCCPVKLWLMKWQIKVDMSHSVTKLIFGWCMAEVFYIDNVCQSRDLLAQILRGTMGFFVCLRELHWLLLSHMMSYIQVKTQ